MACRFQPFGYVEEGANPLHRTLISRSITPKLFTQPETHLCTCGFLLCVVLVMEAEGAGARLPKFSRLTDIQHSKHSICDIPGI